MCAAFGFGGGVVVVLFVLVMSINGDYKHQYLLVMSIKSTIIKPFRCALHSPQYFRLCANGVLCPLRLV